MCACVHVCARFDFRCRACLVILSLPGADGGDGCFCNCLSCAVCCRRASPTQPGEEEQVLSVAKKSFGVGAPLGIDTTSSPHTTRYKSNAQSKTHTRQTKQVHFPHSNPPPLTLQQTCLHSRGGSGEEWRGDVNGPARNPAGLPVQVRQHPESCLLFADQSSMYLCVSV